MAWAAAAGGRRPLGSASLNRDHLADDVKQSLLDLDDETAAARAGIVRYITTGRSYSATLRPLAQARIAEVNAPAPASARSAARWRVCCIITAAFRQFLQRRRARCVDAALLRWAMAVVAPPLVRRHLFAPLELVVDASCFVSARRRAAAPSAARGRGAERYVDEDDGREERYDDDELVGGPARRGAPTSRPALRSAFASPLLRSRLAAAAVKSSKASTSSDLSTRAALLRPWPPPGSE